MPIRLGDGQRFDTFEEGVDDTSPDGSPFVRNTLSIALNTDLTDDSLGRKRNGYTPVNTIPWGTRRIRHGFEYRKSTGVFENLLYGEASAVTGTSGIFGKMAGAGIPTTIATNLADGLKPSIIQFRNLIFVYNGTDDFLYDGTVTRQIGITAPTTAPTLNVLIDGALNQLSPYLYVYTYYNSVTGAESSVSPPSATITTGTAAAFQDGVRLNITAGVAATADTIRIYRTVAGGSSFFLEGTVGIAATTFDSIKADSALSIEIEPDNSRLPEKAKYATVLDNRVFVAGFANNPNRIQYSKIGQEGAKPESFQASDFIDCNLNDGDKIIGLGIANNAILVLKERSVGKLTPIAINSGGVERVGSRKYIYEQLSSEVTGLSHHTLTSVDIFAIWLGRDDIYGTDGAQIFRFGRRILQTYRSLEFSNSYKWSVVNKITTQQLIFSVNRNGQAEPDFQLIGHYRNFPKVAWTYYSPGSNISTHPGLQAGALFQATENNQRVYYFGSSAAVGTVFKFDTGTNDNTKGIYWDIRIPWDHNGLPDKMKMFHSYFATVEGTGQGHPLIHSFEIEKVEYIVVTAVTPLLAQNGALWGAPLWTSFNWAQNAIVPVSFFPHRKAHYGRYGLQNFNADQPMRLIGLVRNVENMTISR